jgi:hypothetical protein
VGGYERPQSPDLTIDTLLISAEESAATILELLAERGFVATPSPEAEGGASDPSHLPATGDA